MPQNTIYLVRKGTELRDAEREARIQITPPANTLVEQILPPIFSRQAFVVPHGSLAVPLDLDGLPLRARIKETGDQVQIYPEFRITGVDGDEGGKQLARAVFHRFDEQLVVIRERLDGIFRSRLGQQPDATELEAIASSSNHASEPIVRTIRMDLGLKVEWTLQPEPQAATWLQKLAISTPISRTLTFNKELPTTEFKLTFTVTVERADLAHVHRVQRRALQNLTPDQEIQRLEARVYEITNPAFRAIWTGINVWNGDIIRELAKEGFGSVVARRVSNEFGYQVRFSDFTPEPNAAVLQALKQVSPQAMLSEIHQGQQKLYLELQKTRQETLLANEGNFESVKDLDERIARAKQEMEIARTEHLQGPQQQIQMLEGVKGGVGEDLRRKFRDALLLEDSSGDEDK